MTDKLILLGVVGRAHGVRGRVRVTSHTADPTALTEYGPLSTSDGRRFTLRWKSEGVAEVFDVTSGQPVRLTDRSQAERLTNTQLFIERSRLPEPEDDEFYLADLVGLTAIDGRGATVGTVSAVHDYGAGASLEIARENAASILLPFTLACVPEISIATGCVTVAQPDEIVVAGEASAQESGASGDPIEPTHDEGERSALDGYTPASKERTPTSKERMPAANMDASTGETAVPTHDEGPAAPAPSVKANGLGGGAPQRHGPARPDHRARHDGRADGTPDEDVGAAA